MSWTAEAIVLAAGRSERIALVAGGTPKPLLAVQGEPIIVRNIRWLRSAGLRRLWVNLHYRGDLVRQALGDGRALGVEIRYSEEREILGTAGAVRRVLPQLDPTALVVYGDNLLNFGLDQLRQFHHDRNADVTIALFDDHTPNTGIAGGRVSLDGDRRVIGFVEGRQGAATAYVNAGVYLAKRDVLQVFPEDKFLDWGKDVFPRLIKEGCRVFGYSIDGYCLGLDTPDSYHRGMELIESGSVRLI
jgi:mannose-1-phosphate guanylyltransferase